MTLNDVIHFEQKLDPSIVDDIHNKFMGVVNWFYNNRTVDFAFESTNRNLKESPQFTHTLKVEDTEAQPNIQTSDNTQFSHMWNDVQPLLKNMSEVLGEEQLFVKRMKANMLLPQPNFNDGDYHPPHWDSEYENSYSMVYYVNDSDGPTYIFDRFWPDSPKGIPILKKINPKKGDFVLFHSTRWHASSNPIINSRRVVLNIVVQKNK